MVPRSWGNFENSSFLVLIPYIFHVNISPLFGYANFSGSWEFCTSIASVHLCMILNSHFVLHHFITNIILLQIKIIFWNYNVLVFHCKIHLILTLYCNDFIQYFFVRCYLFKCSEDLQCTNKNGQLGFRSSR